MDQLLYNWLPEPIAKEARAEEPRRFSALASRFVTFCNDACSSTERNRWIPVVEWLPLVNNFLSARRDFNIREIELVVKALLDVVLNSTEDAEVQVRCCDVLTKMLRWYRKDLLIQIPWRPLYDLLQGLYCHRVPRLEGLGVSSVRQLALFKLVRKTRRFFPPNAPAEIWAMHRADILQPERPEAEMSLGWLSLFMPTQHLTKLRLDRGSGVEALASEEAGATQGGERAELDAEREAEKAAEKERKREFWSEYEDGSIKELGSWLAEWVSVWGQLVHCDYWEGLWLTLMAKVAKHDEKGLLDWSPYVSTIATHLLWVVELPVGTSVASVPVRRQPTASAMILFSNGSTSRTKSLSILLVHLLKSLPSRPLHTEATMKSIEEVVILTEQYYHPSNGGGWTGRLSRVLQGLCRYFMRQLSKQGASPPPFECRVVGEIEERMARCLLTLASRAHFSKDEGLSRTAVDVMSQVAYLLPGEVLPLVLYRLRSALENATATHQLAASVSALARCVRPMLLSGWQPGPEGEGETAAQMLVEAMMALLPGIDANDESKTMAVLNLYSCVLDSIPRLLSSPPEDEPPSAMQMVGGGGGGGTGGAGSSSACYWLPLYLEEWVEEVLQRIFMLLENLDSGPGHRADQASKGNNEVVPGSSFLVQGNLGFTHFMDQLFSKLPDELAESAALMVCQFLVRNNLWEVALECACMVHRLAARCPRVAEQKLAKPMLQQLMAEVPAAGLTSMSSTLESSLRWQIHLLSEVLPSLPQQSLLAYVQETEEVSRRLVACDTRTVQLMGGMLLGSLAVRLCSYILPPRAPGQGPVTASGLALWVDKEGIGFETPRWECPSESSSAAANELIQRHLLGSAQELLRLCEAPGAADTPTLKTQIYGRLSVLRGMLTYISEMLPDFQLAPPPPSAPGDPPPIPLHLVGSPGVTFPPGIREAVADALAATCRAVASYDSALGQAVVAASAQVLLPGTGNFNEAQQQGKELKRLREFFAEPSIATKFMSDLPWRRRQPEWLVADRLRSVLTYRSSQALFRGWATTTRPLLESTEALPPSYLNLLRQVVGLSMHPYGAIRGRACQVVTNSFRRFPVLMPLLIPEYQSALAKLPPPPQPFDPSSWLQQLEAAAAVTEEDKEAPAGTGAGATGGAGAAGGAASEAAGGAGSASTQTEQDAKLTGACHVLLTSQAYWRMCFRDPLQFRMMLLMLLSCRQHATPVALKTINQLLLSAASRLRPPTALDFNSPDYTTLITLLLKLGLPNGGSSGSWRHALLVNVVMLFVLPPPAHPAAAAVTRQLLQLLMGSEILTMRQMATTGLYIQLMEVLESKTPHPGIGEAVAQALSGEGAGERLLSQLSHMHPLLEATEANKDKRGGGFAALQAQFLNMRFEELATRMLRGAADLFEKWPDTVSMPRGISEGYFVVPHAKLMRLLAAIAPRQALLALKAPLERVCSDAVLGQPGSEKSELAAAAELTAGLLASGAVVRGGEGEWLHSTLQRALRLAPLEVLDSWGLAVRFGLRGLLSAATGEKQQLGNGWQSPPQGAHEAMRMMLEGVAAYSGGGAAGSSLLGAIKRVRYLRHVAEELHGDMAVGDAPPQVRAFWEVVLNEVEGLLEAPPPSLRENLGKLLAVLLAHFSIQAAPPSPSPPTDRSSGEGSSGPQTPLQMEVEDDDAVMLLSTPTSLSLQRRVKSLSTSLLDRFTSSVASLQALRGEGATSSSSSIPAITPPSTSTSTSTSTGITRSIPALATDPMAAPSGAFPTPVSGSPLTGALAGGVSGSPLTGALAGGVSGSPLTGALAGGVSGVIPVGSPLTASTLAAVQAAVGPLGALGTSLGGGGGGPAGTSPPAAALAALAAQVKRAGGDPEALRAALGVLAAGGRAKDTDVLMEEAAGSSSALGVRGLDIRAAGGDDEVQADVSQAGICLQLVSSAMHVGSGSLRELLRSCLSPLLRFQELSGPLLQPLALESKSAFVLLKYLPLWEPGQVAGTLDTLVQCGGAEQWSARAAALVYLQYWWFHHHFLLTGPQVQQLQELVVDRLHDSKVEVRAIAAATLSGMLRGLTPESAAALRSRLLQSAATSFARPRRGQKRAAPAPPDAKALVVKQACVQGLKALLMSSPYDSPKWMPKVLMALVAAAGDANVSVRRESASALGEFKRTHEQDSLAALKEDMGADDWDLLQQVTSHATYIA